MQSLRYFLKSDNKSNNHLTHYDVYSTLYIYLKRWIQGECVRVDPLLLLIFGDDHKAPYKSIRM